MIINFPLTEDEIYDIMSESPKFKSIVLAKLFQQQSSLSSLTETNKGEVLNSISLVANLRNYIIGNFRNTTKISAIKYVRQWCVDNRQYLSVETYNDLYSLVGAKKFVEGIIQY
jgi:hypothetical protein